MGSQLTTASRRPTRRSAARILAKADDFAELLASEEGKRAPQAGRCRRNHHPVELPDRHAAWKSAPALAFGNTVVLKPADLVPATASALTHIIDETGFPPGVFKPVIDRGSPVGEAIVGMRASMPSRSQVLRRLDGTSPPQARRG